MLEDKVKQAIQDIRPALQNDGGDIEFVSLAGKEVTVRLVGRRLATRGSSTWLD